MKFRTEIECLQGSPELDHESKVLLLGSCFSEHMERKFHYFKYETFANPFGILFNPKAIEKSVAHCVDNKTYSQSSLMEHQGKWLSLDHHTRFDRKDQNEVLREINKNIELGHQALLGATHVIITLGTSWVYKWRANQQIVGNCHKIPQKNFSKELLTAKEILDSLREILSLVRSINPQAVFIFTVSPVRHLKDGFIENTLSKSMLHKAVHELLEDKSVHYFPAFEIMMDDLRDYRFYKEDLVHPNDMAVNYIWELFQNSWISEGSEKLMREIDEIQRSLAHRPFDPNSDNHKKFRKNLEIKIEKLRGKQPGIEFQKKRK